MKIGPPPRTLYGTLDEELAVGNFEDATMETWHA